MIHQPFQVSLFGVGIYLLFVIITWYFHCYVCRWCPKRRSTSRWCAS